jgi:Flp pilus assembly protein TadD
MTLLLMGRDYAGAVGQFKGAKDRWPHWVPIRIGLSVALVGAGKKAEAQQALREALEIEPESEAVKAGLTRF